MDFKTIAGIASGLCLFSCIVLTSCSSDAEEPGDNRKLRQLTIAEVPLTRATLTDNTNTLGASWNADDKATYFNLSSFRADNMDSGELTAVSSAATSTFTGSVICTTGDNLALFYPATNPTYLGSDRGKFSINLDNQKGTLQDVAEHYHYTYGVGTVTSVTENTADATISSMKSLLAVCKFTFNDGSSTIPVETLEIRYADNDPQYGLSILGYPLTGTVTPAVDAGSVVATATSAMNNPLTINCETSDVVYAALFPVENQDFHFTVTNGSGTYTGTARASLREGKYYRVNLTLTKE
ncbi:MAG: hypothetical protein J6W52_09520 [Bacteroidaceae bacterium]|nr:hypothetical protein [Bacteroidaceae bacterium]